MLLVLSLGVVAQGDSWTGSLSYINDVSNGFTANAANANNTWRASSELSWNVTDEVAGGPSGYPWLYEYTLDVAKWAPRRWMIETDAGFTLSNIDLSTVQVIVDGTPLAYDASTKVSVGWHVPTDGQGTPFNQMPATRHGVVFADTGTGDESTTIRFWSNVAPSWGDLYTNCGGNGNVGWNSGFLIDNPTDPAGNGSISNHVLVPITDPVPIPEPTGIVAFFLLLVGMMLRRPQLMR